MAFLIIIIYYSFTIKYDKIEAFKNHKTFHHWIINFNLISLKCNFGLLNKQCKQYKICVAIARFQIIQVMPNDYRGRAEIEE